MEQLDNVSQLFDRKKLVSPKELADLLNVSERQVRYLATNRQIPALRVGNLLRFEPSVVLKHLKEKGIA